MGDIGGKPVKREATPGAHHYFGKLTQMGGDLIWSAPVWLLAAVS